MVKDPAIDAIWIGCGSFGTARIAHFLSDLTVQRSLVVRLVRG
jgi:hypothetical protein